MSVLVFALAFSLPAFAASDETVTPAEEAPAPVAAEEMPAPLVETPAPTVEAPAPIVEVPAPKAAPESNTSEMADKFKAIQNQQKWVEKLTKQLSGEASQLKEMGTSFAQTYGFDPKKLEEGKYQLDETSGKVTEKY